nr:hypothetical protein [uncultured Butyrivibrio sp.]
MEDKADFLMGTMAVKNCSRARSQRCKLLLRMMLVIRNLGSQSGTFIRGWQEEKDQEVSFALLEIRGKKDFDFRKIVIGNNDETESLPRDIDKIISRAMKLTDKGMNHNDIAAKLKISEELSESICRMYLTHPGVDVAGILQRIS